MFQPTTRWGLARLRRTLVRAVAGSLLLAMPACRIPGLRSAEVGPSLPAGFGTATATTDPTSASCPVPPVAAFYTDPALAGLLGQAVAGNQELKILNEEVQIAANEVLARRGAILPAVGLTADGGFDRNSANMPLGAAERQLTDPRGREFPDPVPRVRLGAVLNWQLDIWRELRNARDAAAARLTAVTERRNAFVTRLVADVADNYYRLLALDARLVVLDQTIALQEESLKVAIARKEAGRGTELAVQRFQAEVKKNQSEKLVVRQEQVEVENRINFLLGRFPQPVERTAGSYVDLTLVPPAAGLPSQLLLTRPDIRQAERELTAAGLDVLVARARFFPRLDITAGVGWEAFNPKYLFDPGSFIASAAGGFVAPFINRAAIRADYQSANARQLQAVYTYQRVVLDAFTDVVTQLTAAENFRQSVEVRKQQLEAQAASVDSATKLFQAARAEYSEVLFAQRDLLDARLDLIDTKRRQLAAVVAAYRALGGGDPAAGGVSQVAVQPLSGSTPLVSATQP
jgi:NodT family efflux transporter outer membrane factor (OMF) lipoprotein